MARTAIDQLVEDCRASKCAPMIGRVASGWIILGQRQVLPGYCLLLPDPVVPHLNALRGEQRLRFLDDMTAVGDALLMLTGGARINYAIFGNVEPALHAHIFPRDATEPASMRTAQPWALDWSAAPEYSAALHTDFQERLRGELHNRGILTQSSI